MPVYFRSGATSGATPRPFDRGLTTMNSGLGSMSGLGEPGTLTSGGSSLDADAPGMINPGDGNEA